MIDPIERAREMVRRSDPQLVTAAGRVAVAALDYIEALERNLRAMRFISGQLDKITTDLTNHALAVGELQHDATEAKREFKETVCGGK